MKKLIVLFAILLSTNAYAASVTLNWTPPVENCDGSTLDDLGGHVIMWGTTPGGPYLNQHNVDDPLATSVSINVGSVENVTLCFVGVSVDLAGNRSDDSCGFSGELCLPFGPISPAPMTLQSVVVD